MIVWLYNQLLIYFLAYRKDFIPFFSHPHQVFVGCIFFFVFMLTLWLLLFFCLFVCFLSLSALISFVFLLCCIFFFLLFLDRFSCSDWASFTEETCTVGRDGLWSSEISTVFILSRQRSARTDNDQSLEHKQEKFCTWCYCVLGGNC